MTAARTTTARSCLLALAAFGLLLSRPAPVEAQVSGSLEGGWYDLSNARNSTKAVLDGKSGGPLFGASIRLPIGPSFFLSGHGRFMQRTGQRVFVEAPGKPVFPLGHPLKLRVVPAYALLGYNIGGGRSSFAPYIALGGGVTSYREESDIAGVKETTSATKPSGHAALGFDYGGGSLRFGLEVSYSLAPNAIGESGVSLVYGEDDVGGASVVARVTFGSR